MEQSAREGVIVKGVGGLYYARQRTEKCTCSGPRENSASST